MKQINVKCNDNVKPLKLYEIKMVVVVISYNFIQYFIAFKSHMMTGKLRRWVVDALRKEIKH